MLGVNRIGRCNVDGVQLFKLAHRRDAVESLNAKLRAVLFARVLSEIGFRDEGESCRARDSVW